MAKHHGLIPSDEADKLYSYPTLPNDSSKMLLGDGTWGVAAVHSTITAGSGKPTANATPAFGGDVTISQYSYNSTGHITGTTDRTITIPNSAASTTAAGLMSKDDKIKLNGIAAGANAYTHPTYTARTGKPTDNQTPAFNATFTISQITSDASGHVTGATDRTVKIPALPTVSSSAYGVMTAAMYNSLTGALSRIASLETILTTTCTSSIDASGCAVFNLSNGTTIIKVDKAGDW